MRFENPVLTKELRSMMRGSKAYVILATSLVCLLIAVMLVLYLVVARACAVGATAATAEVGRESFAILAIALLSILVVVTPGLTSASITTERAQGTLPMLAASLLRPREVVLGKAAAGASFAALLVLASIPMVSAALMFGGVSPLEIGLCYAMMLTTLAFLTAASVLCSAVFKTTAAATAASYGVMVLYLAIVPGAMLLVYEASGTWSDTVGGKTVLGLALALLAGIPAAAAGAVIFYYPAAKLRSRMRILRVVLLGIAGGLMLSFMVLGLLPWFTDLGWDFGNVVDQELVLMAMCNPFVSISVCILGGSPVLYYAGYGPEGIWFVIATAGFQLIGGAILISAAGARMAGQSKRGEI